MFFYDQQIRRYLLQFIRIFGEFDIRTGFNEDGSPILQRVPSRYGDLSRLVGHVIRQNSQNVINSVPFISCWITSLDIDRERTYDPSFVSKVTINERLFDQNENEYTEQIGNRYQVERYMPVPYSMEMQVDIWTSNTDQKLQLLEQILTLFNHGIQLQQNQNLLDWSSIMEVELLGVTWSNRTLPVGTEPEMDIASLSFEIPIWINPPAKVKRQKLIEQIVTRMHMTSSIGDLGFDPDCLDFFGDEDQKIIITPNNARIAVANNEIQLLNQHGSPTGQDGNPLSWKELIQIYGILNEGTSIMRLKPGSTTADMEKEDEDVLGTIAFHPTNENLLLFTVDEDTLPGTTLTPFDKIINPLKSRPGDELPAASVGQRYLLVSDLTDGEEPAIPLNASGPWGLIEAFENDIIEFDGTDWIVAFDSRSVETNQFAKNIATGDLYKWTGEMWIHAFFGEYFPGFWRLEL